MLLTQFDENKVAMFNPDTLHEKNPNFPKACVSFFSYKLIEEFVKHYNPEIIGYFGTSVMPFLPIYKINYKGVDVAVVQAMVGEPLQVANFDELIGMGIKEFVLIGSCGCLAQNIEENSLIVPNCALRDEGTSFHYEPASDEIKLETEAVAVIENTLKSLKLNFLRGKTWTTDAIFRETKQKVELRRNQGAITVDMECAGMAACAKFRGVHFAQFFYGVDDLSKEDYNVRGLLDDHDLPAKARVVPVGIECAYNMFKRFEKN